MSATVRIPTALRGLTEGQSEVQVPPGSLGDVIGTLTKSYPDLGERLIDDGGGLRRFVNVFVADEDIRFLDGLDTLVNSGQVVTILPAVAGG